MNGSGKPSKPPRTFHIELPASPAIIPAYHKGLVTLNGAELLQRKFPPRELLLSPWLPSKRLAMVFAERGIGKTWVRLNIAYATAGDGSFLRCTAISRFTRARRPTAVGHSRASSTFGVLADRLPPA
jgi:hypothetical protein